MLLMAASRGNEGSVRFKKELRQLICYLVASARGLANEPSEYGPLRLLEAGTRLIEAMRVADMSDDALEQAYRGIEASKDDLMAGRSTFPESADSVLAILIETRA
jgi:hypothetical protein